MNKDIIVAELKIHDFGKDFNEQICNFLSTWNGEKELTFLTGYESTTDYIMNFVLENHTFDGFIRGLVFFNHIAEDDTIGDVINVLYIDSNNDYRWIQNDNVILSESDYKKYSVFFTIFRMRFELDRYVDLITGGMNDCKDVPVKTIKVSFGSDSFSVHVGPETYELTIDYIDSLMSYWLDDYYFGDNSIDYFVDYYKTTYNLV